MNFDQSLDYYDVAGVCVGVLVHVAMELGVAPMDLEGDFEDDYWDGDDDFAGCGDDVAAADDGDDVGSGLAQIPDDESDSGFVLYNDYLTELGPRVHLDHGWGKNFVDGFAEMLVEDVGD